MFKSLLSPNSDVSSMRAMSFISLFIGGIIAIVGLYKGVSLSELAILCGVFVGSAFGGKVLQHKNEIKK